MNWNEVKQFVDNNVGLVLFSSLAGGLSLLYYLTRDAIGRAQIMLSTPSDMESIETVLRYSDQSLYKEKDLALDIIPRVKTSGHVANMIDEVTEEGYRSQLVEVFDNTGRMNVFISYGSNLEKEIDNFSGSPYLDLKTGDRVELLGLRLNEDTQENHKFVKMERNQADTQKANFYVSSAMPMSYVKLVGGRGEEEIELFSKEWYGFLRKTAAAYLPKLESLNLRRIGY